MSREISWSVSAPFRFALVCVVILAARLYGDQVELFNGDRYSGRILSFDTNSVVLQNDVIGTVTLPRKTVAAIHIGVGTPPARLSTNAPSVQGRAAGTNVLQANRPALATSTGTNIMEQVRAQLLSEAGPEANNKFDELAGGLLSGKLSVEDIRAQAKSVSDQVHALKRDYGDDATGSLDSYLAILDKFLAETPPGGVPTNSVKSSRITTQKPSED